MQPAAASTHHLETTMQLDARFSTSRVENPHPAKETAVYTLDGIIYLPHYRVAGMFVSPGYGNAGYGHQTMYTAAELIKAGAAQSKRALWVR